MITGNFVKQYKLTVSTDPKSGRVNPNGGNYDASTPVNLIATPVFPYAFKNWVGTDNNNINPTNVTMNADKSVTAVFAECTKGELKTATGAVSKDALGRCRQAEA